MIKFNDKNFELTVKAVSSKTSNIKDLVIQECGTATLISEDKVIYHYLNDKKMTLFHLEKKIKDLVSSLKNDVNIDIDSYIEALNFKSQEVINLVCEASLYANHQVFSMKSENKPTKNINLICKEKDFDSHKKRAEIKIEFVNFARDLQDLPPNVGTSIEIAKRIEEKAKSIPKVKVTILGKAEIEKLKMGLLLSVNQGSYVDPRVVVLEYVGDPKAEKTALIGKGITFDSGGYNLKPSNFLDGMKFDMSGAAIMSSTVMALAKAEAKCNVVSVAMLTDNRIGGKATLTESVIKSMNGKTVEINNTDAEGRLVLADGITYAVRNLKAEKLIDAATLTGAIVVALGGWHTGAFTKSDELWDNLSKASEISRERVWRQPIIGEHLKAMQISKIADLTNAEPSRNAGSSTAAAFLDSFAEDKPFLHLDIAGTADNEKRGTGIMIRTIFEMLNK